MRLRSLILFVLCTVLCLSEADALSNVSLWADNSVCEAYLQGLQPSALTNRAAAEPVTRAEFCAIALRVYQASTGLLVEPTTEVLFSDCRDKYVNTAAKLGLVSGRGGRKFDPDATISRQELSVMLCNVLMTADLSAPAASLHPADHTFSDTDEIAPWAQDKMYLLVDNGIMKGVPQNGTVFLRPLGRTTRQEALILASRFTTAFGDPMALRPEPDDGFVPEVVFGDVAELDHIRTITGGHLPMTIAEKTSLVFGAGAPSFVTRQSAEYHMTEIEIPVWRLKSNGEKVGGTTCLKVHETIAPLVQQIFQEIYNGSEKFPIKSIGGYAWRDRTTSEHRCGTAIDINWNENMEATINADGSLTPMTGKYWNPNSDPYSIPENGDVVKAFSKYGFIWGGNAWRTKRDYMHFSYFGK